MGHAMNTFDVVLMNPPYQSPKKSGSSKSNGRTIWEDFVNLSLDLVADEGFVCSIHPARWRKPGDETGQKILDNRLIHLQIHNSQKGIQTFGAGTRFDWYIFQKTALTGYETVVVDENAVSHILCLSNKPFIPNFDFKNIYRLLAANSEEKCQLIFKNDCRQDKAHMSPTQDGYFIHPCVNQTGITGVTYLYSAKKFAFFDTPKVIFGDGGAIANAVVDYEGQYGMTSHSMGIPISSKEEGLLIKKALESERFQDFLRACRWSNFQIDWRIFRYLKKDFWKEFID